MASVRASMGGTFSMRMESELEPIKEFIFKLHSSENYIPIKSLFKHVNLSDTNEGIDSFNLIYDIESVNIDEQWRRDPERHPINLDFDTSTYLKTSLKSKFLYHTIYKSNESLEFLDLALALDLAFSPSVILTNMPTDSNFSNEFSGKIVKSDFLKHRNLLAMSIANPEARSFIFQNLAYLFIEESNVNIETRNGDDPSNFSRYILPLTRTESDIYSRGVDEFESLHMGFNDAIALSYTTRVSQEYITVVHKMNAAIVDSSISSLRVERPMNRNYFRDIYSLTPMLSEHAYAKIKSTINSTIYIRNLDHMFRNLTSQFGITSNRNDVMTDIVRNIDVGSLPYFITEMLIMYTNPNVSKFVFENSYQTSDFDISIIIGGLIIQTILPSGFIDLSSRIWFNNYIARIIVRHFKLQNAMIPDSLNPNMSTSLWYGFTDRLYLVYNSRGMFHQSVTAFLSLLFKNLPRITPESASCLPWCGGLDAHQFNLYSGYNIGGDHIPSIEPIIPTTFNDLLNFDGAGLSAIITAFMTMLRAAQGMTLRPDAVNSIMNYFVERVDAIKGICNVIHERLCIVSLLPYANNKLIKENESRRKQISIDLRKMPSILCGVRSDLERVVVAHPKFDNDDAVQVVMPILAYFYNFFQTRLRNRQAYSTKDILNKILSIASVHIPLDVTTIYKLSQDTTNLKNMLKMFLMHNPDRFTNIYLDRAIFWHNFLTANQYSRGYRPHFYIVYNYHNLNVDLGPIRSGYITTGIHDISNNVRCRIIKQLTGFELVQLSNANVSLEYMYGHTVFGINNGFDRMLNDIRDNTSSYVKATSRDYVQSIIKVVHPCIVNIRDKVINTPMTKLNPTPFVNNDHFMKNLRLGLPISIDIDYVVMSSRDIAPIRRADYDRCYTMDHYYLTADIDYPHFTYARMNEAVPQLQSHIVMRKDCYSVKDSSYAMAVNAAVIRE